MAHEQPSPPPGPSLDHRPGLWPDNHDPPAPPVPRKRGCSSLCNRPVPLHRTARARMVTRMGCHAGSRPLDVRAACSSPSRRRAPDEIVERTCAESPGGPSRYGVAARLLRSCSKDRRVAGAAGPVHPGESGARRSCWADWRVSVCVVGLGVMPASGRHYHSADPVPVHRASVRVVPAAGRQPQEPARRCVAAGQRPALPFSVQRGHSLFSGACARFGRGRPGCDAGQRPAPSFNVQRGHSLFSAACALRPWSAWM